MDKPRTIQQNKAIHVLFEMIAEELNRAGLDMRKALKPDVELPWNKDTVKEYIWKPVQQAQLLKKSTTELTSKEIDEVFDTINRFMGQRWGLHIPFPSIEEVLLMQDETN